MPSKPVPVVVEGQVWKDNDPRRANRLLKVIYVEPLRFVVFQVIASQKKTTVHWYRIEQSSAKKGYSLVASPASAATPTPASAPSPAPLG